MNWCKALCSKVRIKELIRVVVGLLLGSAINISLSLWGLPGDHWWIVPVSGGIASGLYWFAMDLKTNREDSKSGLPTEAQSSSVPKLGEFFLYLCLTKKERDSLPGDLEEELTTVIVPKFGPRYARSWYWGQVGRSIGPLLWRLFVKLVSLSWLVNYVRRWIQS